METAAERTAGLWPRDTRAPGEKHSSDRGRAGQPSWFTADDAKLTTPAQAPRVDRIRSEYGAESGAGTVTLALTVP
jgi:hypothetical protein